MRILVAEDEQPVATYIKKSLEGEGYAVDVAADGRQALDLAGQFAYDGMILDLGLPDADGVTVLKHLRANKSTLPIIVLTGRCTVADRVNGLDNGADDFVSKPFSFAELLARLRSVTRRERRAVDAVLSVADLELNRVERSVSRGGRKIELTSKEFGLLEFLMRNAGRRVTRNMIVENVWNMSFDSMTNVVDVYINYLRNKIDKNYDVKLIRTIRGIGYQLGDLTGAPRPYASAA